MLATRPNALNDQRSAISDQRSAITHQRSAITELGPVNARISRNPAGPIPRHRQPWHAAQVDRAVEAAPVVLSDE